MSLGRSNQVAIAADDIRGVLGGFVRCRREVHSRVRTFLVYVERR